MILLILNSYVLCIVIIIRHKRIPVSCFSFYYALVKINMAFRKNPSTDEVLPNMDVPTRHFRFVRRLRLKIVQACAFVYKHALLFINKSACLNYF